MAVERILLRRDTAANWTAANPVLALGEEGVERDTLRRKFGDGVTTWTALPYAVRPPADLDGDMTAKVNDTTSQTRQALGAAFGPQGIYATEHGVKADGTTDDTAAMMAAIDAAISAGTVLLLPRGTILTGPLDMNGSSYSTPADSQWTGLLGMIGAGRNATAFKAKSGAYTAGQYVLSHRNVAGTVVGGFTVDGAGVADHGANFSWTGGSQGNPSLTPSNRNTYTDIHVKGCSAQSIKFDGQHDGTIARITVEGSTATGISHISPGGMVSMRDVIVAGGTFDVAAQNGELSNCGFFGGVTLLSGGDYNALHFNGGQIYPSAAGVSIDAESALASTQGLVFTDVHFPQTTTVIQGRYHQGVEFLGCTFVSYTNFFGTITPASGAGQPPVFALRNCSLGSTAPADVSGAAHVRIEHCRASDGTIIDQQTWIDYTPTWKAGGTAVTLGDATLTGRWSKRGSEVRVRVYAVVGSTTVLPAGTWTFDLPALASSAGGWQVGVARLAESGVRLYVANAKVDPGGSSVDLVHTETGDAGTVTTASPFAWASGDTLAFELIYEAA